MKNIVIIGLLSAASCLSAQTLQDCTLPKTEVPLMWLGTVADAIKKKNPRVPKQINQLSAEWKNELKKGAVSNYSKLAGGYYCTAYFEEGGAMYISFAEIKSKEEIDVRSRPGLKNRLNITAFASKGADAYRNDAKTCFEIKTYNESNELNVSYVNVDKKFGFPTVAESCE